MAGKSTLFALLLGDVSPDNGTIAIEKNATIGFLPQETAFQVRETLSTFVGGNDEPVSIVAVHSNIAFDFVELKLDAVLHDGEALGLSPNYRRGAGAGRSALVYSFER